MSSSSNNDDQNEKPCFIDRIKTEMNACSLEVLRNFQQQSNNNNNDDVDDDASNTLPTVIGCYQLEDNNTASDKVEEDSTKSSSVRKGSLRLYMIDQDKNSISPQFDEPTNICETEAGILDGKWFQSGKLRIQVENNDEKEESKILERSHHVYASACASGKIWLHYLADNNDSSPSYERNTTSCLKALGCSSCNQDENITSLCLALDIDERNIHTDGLLETGYFGEARIVSSYSDGSTAIHSVSFGQQYNDNTEEEKDPNEIVEIIKEEERWDCAHKLFGGIPAEVWSCCWSKSDNNLILTGGDDCKLKGWDISRGSNSKPVFQVGQDEFEAGVTCLSWHPNSSLHPYTFASGSYDEGIRIWDLRQMNRPLLKSKLDSCGGGVWRMKWHPKCPEKLLVGAMHGGCRILEIPSLSPHTFSSNSTSDLQEKDEYKIKIAKSFTLHESMAYGADWLTNNIAASCSFYDQQAFMWET